MGLRYECFTLNSLSISCSQERTIYGSLVAPWTGRESGPSSLRQTSVEQGLVKGWHLGVGGLLPRIAQQVILRLA